MSTQNTPLETAEGRRSAHVVTTGMPERAGLPELRVVSRGEYAQLQAEQVRRDAAARRALGERHGALPEPPEPQTNEPGRGRRRSSNPEATRRLTDVDVSAIKRLLMGQDVAPGAVEEPLTQDEVCDRANLSPALVAQIASTRRGAAVRPMDRFGWAMRWLDRVEREQDPVRHDLIRSLRESPNVGKAGHTTSASRERYFDGSRVRRLPKRFVSTGHALGGRGGRVAAIAGQGFRVEGVEASPMRTERTAADPYAGAATLRTAEDFTLAGLEANVTAA